MDGRFTIIGAGMGPSEVLTFEARQAIEQSGCVLASERLARQLSDMRPDMEICPLSEFSVRARAKDGTVALLVSGDAGFFSAAKKLISELSAFGETRVLCGVSSMQYFCAKLKTSYDDAVILSLHGRSGSLLGAVSYAPKVFVLTGGNHTAASLCHELAQAGLGDVKVSIGENLGSKDERILSGTAAEFVNTKLCDLAVMLVEHACSADAELSLRDCDFVRGEVPMTKEEIRWLSACKLRIKSGDTVFDIGAGTGSVTMELARKAHRGIVYAVERNETALELIEQNRRRTGCFNVRIVPAEAPDGLEELPAPDCAFLGGTGGNMKEILALLKDKNPDIRVVINVITLESLHEASSAMEELGFCDREIIQISVSRAKKMGRYHMMTGQNPVFILSGGGRCDD